MTKLDIHFNPKASNSLEEVRIGAPFELLETFLSLEVGHSVRNCEEWRDVVRLALAGTPAEDEDGKSFVLCADASTANFRNFYASPPGDAFAVPTPILLEALERWLAYLLEQGYTRSELDPRQFD